MLSTSSVGELQLLYEDRLKGQALLQCPVQRVVVFSPLLAGQLSHPCVPWAAPAPSTCLSWDVHTSIACATEVGGVPTGTRCSTKTPSCSQYCSCWCATFCWLSCLPLRVEPMTSGHLKIKDLPPVLWLSVPFTSIWHGLDCMSLPNKALSTCKPGDFTMIDEDVEQNLPQDWSILLTSPPPEKWLLNTTTCSLLLTQLSTCKRTFTPILWKFNFFNNFWEETQAIQTVKTLGLIGGSLCPGLAGSSSKLLSPGDAGLAKWQVTPAQQAQ